jgi:hypothetical protein
MNPVKDVLYRVHQVQAQRRGRSALPYDVFCARLHETYETDMTRFLLPSVEATLAVQIKPSTPFTLGILCITPEALNSLPADELLKGVRRHAAGDWGTVNQNKWLENDQAMRNGGRLFSAYEASCGQKFWVVTAADRKLTTVLLPEQY